MPANGRYHRNDSKLFQIVAKGQLRRRNEYDMWYFRGLFAASFPDVCTRREMKKRWAQGTSAEYKARYKAELENPPKPKLKTVPETGMYNFYADESPFSYEARLFCREELLAELATVASRRHAELLSAVRERRRLMDTSREGPPSPSSDEQESSRESVQDDQAEESDEAEGSGVAEESDEAEGSDEVE